MAGLLADTAANPVTDSFPDAPESVADTVTDAVTDAFTDEVTHAVPDSVADAGAHLNNIAGWFAPGNRSSHRPTELGRRCLVGGNIKPRSAGLISVWK